MAPDGSVVSVRVPRPSRKAVCSEGVAGLFGGLVKAPVVVGHQLVGVDLIGHLLKRRARGLKKADLGDLGSGFELHGGVLGQPAGALGLLGRRGRNVGLQNRRRLPLGVGVLPLLLRLGELNARTGQ